MPAPATGRADRHFWRAVAETYQYPGRVAVADSIRGRDVRSTGQADDAIGATLAPSVRVGIVLFIRKVGTPVELAAASFPGQARECPFSRDLASADPRLCDVPSDATTRQTVNDDGWR
jgi:hypothetical protein